MLIYLSIFTILISLLLLYHNWNVNRTSVFLFMFFILISIYGITHYLTIYTKNSFLIAIFYNNFSPYFLLLGPFLLFYVRNTIKERQGLKKIDYLHFMPALFHFIGIIPYYLKSFDSKMEIAQGIADNVDNLNRIDTNFFFSTTVGFIVRPILLLIYILASLFILFQISKTKNVTTYTGKLHVNFKWLLFLIVSLLILVLYLLTVTYLSIVINPNFAFKSSKILLIISSTAYFLMSFSLLIFPSILYGLPQVETKKNGVNHNQSITEKKENSTQKKIGVLGNSKDLLPLFNAEDPFYEMAVGIKDYLLIDQPFIKPDFSQHDISVDLKIPLNDLSYCFNVIFKTKFTLLKAHLRIAHAKQILQSDSAKKMTIEAIGQQCGFSTRSNFYATFKHITNTTPAEYLLKCKDS